MSNIYVGNRDATTVVTPNLTGSFFSFASSLREWISSGQSSTSQIEMIIPEPVITPIEMSQERIDEIIARYEQEFEISSEEFLEQFHDGVLPDTFETMDWMILLRHR